MNKRLLFCVETTQQANTDYPYILETIRHYYQLSSRITIRPVHMGSKTRYNSRAVQEDIKRQSGSAETTVIYCIDTDNCDTSRDTDKQLDQIKTYCNTHGYEFIFFCRDIEDVYCKEQIPDTKKINAIKRFRSTRAIETLQPDHLRRSTFQRHCSNIMNVLDKYLEKEKA